MAEIIITKQCKVTTSDPDDNLLDLVETLLEINLDDPTLKSNEYSMSDNNGNRILF